MKKQSPQKETLANFIYISIICQTQTFKPLKQNPSFKVAHEKEKGAL